MQCPGTKLSMTVGNCNLGDIRLSAWTTLISTDQNQAMTMIQGNFDQGKNCDPAPISRLAFIDFSKIT